MSFEEAGAIITGFARHQIGRLGYIRRGVTRQMRQDRPRSNDIKR